MSAKAITPAPDNYAAFLARLEAATKTLSARVRSLDKALSAVSLLLERYRWALQEWEQRRTRVSEELTRHSGEPQTCVALSELHQTALQMESMHRAQTVRITEKLSVMQGRRNAIARSLMELEASRAKLDSSRMLSRDRENLGRVLYELAGAGGVSVKTSDLGLRNDLKEARDAVILAEALMEVKES